MSDFFSNAPDALSLYRRQQSETIASSFLVQRQDQFGGQIYNRSNATIANLSTLLGASAIASGNRSTALGAFAYAKEDSATAVGVYAQAWGQSSIAIGDQAKATGYRAISLGSFGSGNAVRAIAIGVGAIASGEDSIAIGTGTTATGSRSTAVGVSADAIGDSSTAVGHTAQGTATAATAVGFSAIAGDSATAIGVASVASGNTSIAIGFSTEATAIDSIAIGDDATAVFLNSVALGKSTATTTSNQFQMGNSTTPLYGFIQRFEEVRYADQFPGSDIGVKIAAALTDLPASGGIVDATAFQGAQSLASTLTLNKPCLLKLGACQISASAEINPTVDYVFIDMPMTTLSAVTTSISLLHWCASNGGVIGGKLTGNDLSGTSGIRVTPISESGTSVRTETSFNNFYNTRIGNVDEGLVFQCGPTVALVQSDCSFNAFSGLKFDDCIRAMWFKPHPTDASAAQPDSNQFFACLTYNTGTRTNTGIQIDAGGTNTFDGCSVGGMVNGTTPNNPPVGLRIAGRNSVTGADNNGNTFNGQRSETNTRTLEVTSPGGSANWVQGYGFSTATVVDNGNSSILHLGDNYDKAVWYAYSDTDARAHITSALEIDAGLYVKEGVNAMQGVGTLSGGGTFTVATTRITTSSRVMLTPQNSSGTAGSVWVSSRTAASNFVVSSTNILDTRAVAWVIFEPA